ncbi:hypothetical protein EGT67_18960 [Prescottella agglutinans]|uniref:Uncharacterized protein n=1 Tax=Prescottella agglutinans TaxID=1644129 RepID=A0A3S3AM41_9NOCA|nr:hypothetical protein [Prescottella agglutinans]RVW08007.1 hypothetical protein EGT67_18960 [Prescottella agglutinans]
MSIGTTSRAVLRVGTRTQSRYARVNALLAESDIALPAGSALLGPTVAELLTPRPGSASAVRERLSWRAHDPIDPDDSVRTESVITQVAADGDTAVVVRRVVLRDNVNTLREEIVETWRVRDGDTAPTVPATDFCTDRWGVLVRDSLAADPDFASSLATWDGTIGLRCDDREIHLRVYRGRIIDVTRRTPGGATFTFIAPGHTWVDLMLGERNDFMRRAITGEFSSAGDGYEYLRLTKPLNIVIAHARAIAQEAQS